LPKRRLGSEERKHSRSAPIHEQALEGAARLPWVVCSAAEELLIVAGLGTEIGELGPVGQRPSDIAWKVGSSAIFYLRVRIPSCAGDRRSGTQAARAFRS